MANEIYDSSWWGNTIDTASSIGTSTEMIQGQFNLTKIGAEEVVNGDFATDSDWTKGGGATISGGQANIIGDGSAFGYVEQTNVLVIGKTYRITLNAVINSGGGLVIKYGLAFSENIGSITSSGFYSFKYTAGVSGPIIIGRRTGGVAYNSSVDNVSVKEVRASSVEAVKCLADAIHRIGIQNIQN